MGITISRLRKQVTGLKIPPHVMPQKHKTDREREQFKVLRILPRVWPTPCSNNTGTINKTNSSSQAT